ncbi:MAG: response regulator [Proteobacteria bacterium]|nr:response regulator [Pseudomonadota bacterium]
MSDTPGEQRFLDGKRVLIVEDEAIISFMLEDMFAELGALQVDHAASIAAAMSCLNGLTPDLAVLDVNLGGDRVYPVADALEAKGVKFLFTTGYGRGGIEPAWTHKLVVQKPFNVEQMTTALRELLGLD